MIVFCRFLPSRPAANAVREAIRELYRYPWTSWSDLNEDERTYFFNGFRVSVHFNISKCVVFFNLLSYLILCNICFLNVFTMQKRVAWHKSQEAAVKDLFHKKAAQRLPDLLRRVRMGRNRPLWMGEQVYNHLRDHIWNDPNFKAKCERNKKNRASEKGGSLHTGGSISMLQHSERLVYS